MGFNPVTGMYESEGGATTDYYNPGFALNTYTRRDRTPAGNPDAGSSNSLFGFMVGSAVAQLPFTTGIPGLFQGSAGIMADSTREIANTNAGATIAIARDNNETAVNIANNRAGAIVEQARLQSLAIYAQANAQYLSTRNQMRFLEKNDNFEAINWKFQMQQDVKGQTLLASAKLHADHAAHQNREIAMQYENARRNLPGATANPIILPSVSPSDPEPLVRTQRQV